MKSAESRFTKSSTNPSIFSEILSILEEAIPTNERQAPRALLAQNRREDGTEEESKSVVPNFETNSRLWAGLGMTALAGAVLFFGSRHDAKDETAATKPSGFKGWLLQTARLVAGAGVQSLFSHVFSTAPSAKLISRQENEESDNHGSYRNERDAGNDAESMMASDDAEASEDEDLGSPRRNAGAKTCKRNESTSARTLS